MGSQGIDRLTDYPGTPGGASGAGGTNGEDRCSRAFSAAVEEVERCDYYQQHGDVPPNGTDVSITVDTRISVVTGGGEIIGYLSTQYNYLAACIQDGYRYVGIVTSASKSPIANVQVDIAPENL